MTATRSDTNSAVPMEPAQKPESVLEEEIDALYPDRAHHDELGRTAEIDHHNEPSPREQPARPIDIKRVDE